jgi:hypothetical protein
MLRPFLLVGVGGSGGKTLRAVRDALLLRLQQEHWSDGWPDAWQFIHVDSPTAQDGTEFPASFLPSENYLSLVPSGVNYASIYNSISARAETKYKADIEGPLPSPLDVKVPVAMGAGAYRAIGRAIAASALGDINTKAKSALTKLQSGVSNSQLEALTKHLGMEVTGGNLSPVVIVVSSIAGGSGAGMFIDVTEAVKSAAGGQPWADQVFGILYAPDVFEQIGNMDAIAPNALGAMVETMSGLWNANPTESTTALYRSQGVLTANNVEYNLGPGMSYIVGRKNGLVDFSSQTGVYKATATSLAAWMTDVSIQTDLTAYAFTNLPSRADNFIDNSGLKRSTKDLPPFSSMGFARVTMGTERFLEYSAERLAKSALETMVGKHLENDPDTKEKTEDQWIQYFADLNEGRFLADSGLYEATEENNQVVEAILPDMSELQAKLKAAITTMVHQGMTDKGHSFDNWVLKICNAYEVNLPGILDELTALRHAKIREWVELMPTHTLRLISLTISQQGLPVTVELVRRALEQTKKACQDLESERSKHLSDASSLQNFVSREMGAAASFSVIPPQNPAVINALHQAQVAFHWRALADIKLEAAAILHDFSDNFLEPLLREIDGGLTDLRNKLRDPKLMDGRKNPYKSWPNEGSIEVPMKFHPAPNERLLIDHEEYPQHFDSLVKQTISDAKVDAKRVVIDQLIMGSYGSDAVRSLDEKLQWKIVDQSQQWVPRDRSHQLRESAPQPGKFDFLVDHLGYVDRAKIWLEIPGRAFSSFLDQTIATFLSGSGDKAEYSKRRQRFVKEFSNAVSFANPLVELNQALVGQTHTPDGNEKSILISDIPIDKSDELYEALKNTLVTLNYWEDKKSEDLFVGSSAGGLRKSIDIFTQTNIPLQPMVMGSVMGPIATTWSRLGSKKDSRTAFMKWRRGRTLPEAIPAHPEVWQQMVKGWYVMRLLNMFEQSPRDESYDQKGPKLGIWVNSSLKYVQFPYPLYFPGIAPVGDLPGIVLQSLTIALVNCYQETSLLPLEPYKRLLELGDSDSEGSELSEWIRNGSVTKSGAPSPQIERAGSPADGHSERQRKCTDWLEAELAMFKENLKAIEKQDDFRSYPVTWEIRAEITSALTDLIRSVSNTRAQESL